MKGRSLLWSKIDVHIKDALNRSHQCATVQLDFQMPEKFELTYINEQNEKNDQLYCIENSIRFTRPLLRYFNQRTLQGAFPLWMAPVQVNLIGVSNNNDGYVRTVTEALRDENIRVAIDDRKKSLAKN